MRYAEIMAGGSGTRLWPMSSADRPKQLIPFVNGRSLLEIAAARLDELIDAPHRLICTGESFRDAIRAALPVFGDEQILGEPEGRDTLAAVGLPAAILLRRDPEAVIAVFTADHVIEPVDVFRRCVNTAFEIIESNPDTLVTFGIAPTHAATGYGYVELGESVSGFEAAYQTGAFKEKPDAQTASQYLASGRYLWNSGMFVWKRAATLMACIERYESEMAQGLKTIADAWDTPERQNVLAKIYPTLKKISVDFGVMEPASRDPAVRLATVAMPVTWLDVGSWPAYGQTLQADEAGNQISAPRALVLDGSNHLIVSDREDQALVVVGGENLVIVQTARATLICDRAHAEQIKQAHAAVREKFGPDYV